VSGLVAAARRRLADEGGVALITALLVTIVAAVLGTTAVQLAIHNTDASAYDRGRAQSVHAAEAGLDAVLAMAERTSSGLLPCTMDGELSARPVASWSAEITWFSSYPPNPDPATGNALNCNFQGVLGVHTAEPRGVHIVSTGYVHTSTGIVERKMELQARVSGIRGRYDKAIVSNKTPVIANNLLIRGNRDNDGDVLSNENFVCNNSIVIQGSVYVADGWASLGNTCTIAEDLWANEQVTMSNSSRVNGDLYSTLGPISMNLSSYVARDANSGAACNGCTGRVGGRIVTNKKLPPPPEEGFPDMIWDALAWQQEGWQVLYPTCSEAVSWITNSANQNVKAILRITSTCDLAFNNRLRIPRTAPLAVFTDGSISVNNNVTFYSANNEWQDLLLIVSQDATCGVPAGNGNITMVNQTTFQQIRFFVYSPCVTSFSNGDSNARGQLYGDTVRIMNQLSFTYHEMLVPGNGEIHGYGAEIAYIREIQ
jgi:hypothetical protein